ncbi:MAG: choice-of-anchor Q domain-containing protein [Verrucomicrobiota bacterium JB023]|nr:choice-of-anchor Q domain-containing protein [Verrucomicrobiota bacterium JB023]
MKTKSLNTHSPGRLRLGSGQARLDGRPSSMRTILVGVLGLVSAGSLHAVDYQVTTSDDEAYDGGTLAAEQGDGDGLSLREAIALANLNGPDGGDDDGDTISFDPLSFLLAPPSISLGSELVITDDVVIDGGVPFDALVGQAVLDGGGMTRLISIDTSAAAGGNRVVELMNFELANGLSSGNGGGMLIAGDETVALSNVDVSGCEAVDGGGLYNGGTVTIVDSSFDGNVASGPSGSGGAIFNASGGQLLVTDTDFDSNVANRAGGAIEDQSGGMEGFDIVLTGATFTANNAGVSPMATAAPGNGGAIHITGSGSMQISNCSADANVAAREGGAFWNGSGLMEINLTSITDNVASGPAADDGGGGVFNNGGTLTIDGGTIADNVADGASGSGGGIFSTDGMVTLTDVEISSNVANRAGGGIELVDGGLSLMNVFLGGDEAEDGNIAGPDGSAAPGNGGGFHVSGEAMITVSGGLVGYNQAAREGGGLWNQAGSTMTVTGGALIADNVALGDAADDGGGGIFNNGGVLEIDDTDGAVMILRNSATGTSGSGGGLLNATGSMATITGATFSNNLANRAGGAIEEASGLSGEEIGLSLTATTLSDNNAGVTPAVGAPGSGGALHVSGPGDVFILGGLVSGNVAASEGGGLWNGSGLMTINGVTIEMNTASGAAADQGGGGVFNAGGTVTITNATEIVDNVADGASGSGGGIFNDAGGVVSVFGSDISSNRANRAGGGIEDNSGEGLGLTVTDTTMDSNLAGTAPAVAAPGNGGALHITGPGDATFTGGMVSNNIAALEGGGLWNGSGTLTVNGTTISNNEAQGDELHDGGGGLFNNGGTLVLEESVIVSGNVASGTAGSGGGILNLTNGTVSVTDSSITSNVANRAGGGIEDQSALSEGTAITLVNVSLNDNNVGVSPAVAAPGNGGGLHVSGVGNVMVTGGEVSGNLAAAEGGGLWNGTGLMVVDGVTLSENVASGDSADQGGGALFNAGGAIELKNSMLSLNVADGTAGSGGGVLNDVGSTLTVTDSTFSQNVSNRAGGGIEDNSGADGGVMLTNVDFMANNTGVSPATASPGNGGALHITGPGDATIMGGMIEGNLAAAEGGGLWNGSGMMTVTGVSLTNNVASGDAADQGGGGLFNAGGTLIVEEGSVISGNVADGASGSGGGILSDASGTLELSDTMLLNNMANRAGGALEVTGGTSTTITTAIMRGNVAGPEGSAAPGNGGAIHISGDGEVVSSTSWFDGNSAANEGGGLWNSGAGTLTVSASAITGNDSPDGGGLYNQAGNGVTTVTNSTLSGNTATNGGGIQIEGGTMNLLHVTVAGNSAMTGGGANVASGSFGAVNSVLADNSAELGPDLAGMVVAMNSLLENASGASGIVDLVDGNIVGEDPLLSSLADNGGLTPTHRPSDISPVVDAGDAAAAASLTTDQRGMGFMRAIGGGVDMGALEVSVLRYADWVSENFTEATPVDMRDPEDDPEGDGLANGLEWLMGLDPEAKDENPIGFSADGSELTLSYPRVKQVPAGSDIFETSPDLVVFTPNEMGDRMVTSLSAPLEMVVITLDTSGTDQDKLFARLRVEGGPAATN